jgi:hypothetical protein
MSTTQVRGGQIQANTVTSGQVDSSVIIASGANSFTGTVSGQTPTSANHLATKGYTDALAQGLAGKYSAEAATTGSESFTISAGNVTLITGTSVDGVSPNVNDYILIKDAPSATGAGSVGSTQPGNGLYQVTSNTTNLSVSRAADMSGSNAPVGTYVFVSGGTANASSGWVVSTPSTSAAFTYGTNNIKWTQFSGAGEVTIDSSLTKSANQLGRAALTGDVTASAGSNATTIASGAVTLTKQANLAANSVIGNNTGSSAAPVAVPLSNAGAVAASTVPLWDANSNLAANVHLPGFTTTATAAGTTTLTISTATQIMVWTGSSTQTVKLPTTGIVAGTQFTVINESSGNVTVQSSGANTLLALVGAASAPFSAAVFTAKQATPTTAAHWSYATYATGSASGTVTSASVVSANGFAGSVATATSTPAITLSTTVTGVLKGNGTSISAASNTAGADYVNASNFITRETPSGTVNGSTTAFTLANTPIAGTEQVFLNGVLQEPGAGNDYTISGATITYLTAPLSGDRLRVSYQK